MTATVAGILLSGDHASRPAASAPPVGSVYSCSDHDLIYVTTGSVWNTWATLGGTVPAFGDSSDITSSAPGDTVAAGATGEIADAGHRHARESYATLTAGLTYGSSGDIAASDPGDTAVAGAVGEPADAGHVHARLNETLVVNFVIDGGGSAITTGIKGDVYCPFAFTITSVVLLADTGGAIVVDIWEDSYANFPPTDADSITASAPPTIAATGDKSKDSTLTGWSTAVAADAVLRFNVDSIATITRCTVALYGVRT